MNQKGLAPILIIVVILTIFVAGYYLGQQKIKPSPVPQPTTRPSPSPADASPTPTGAGETANWKMYTNTKYGYSIKYPSSLSAEINQYPELISFDRQIFITVEDINKPPCQGDCDTETVQKTETVKLNQLNATKYTGIKNVSRIAGYSPPQSFVRYEIIHNNYKYKLEITELGNLNHSYQEEELYPANRIIKEIPTDKLYTFNQILQTFKFLK